MKTGIKMTHHPMGALRGREALFSKYRSRRGKKKKKKKGKKALAIYPCLNMSKDFKNTEKC